MYFAQAKNLLGNHLSKKRPWQPLSYAFTDFENSRHGHSDARSSVLAHVHSLTLVPPRLLKRFEVSLSDPRLRLWALIKDIKIERFDPAKGTLKNLASYCMKGVDQTPQGYAERNDLWAIFPR
jgi:hypothetical protein